MTKDAMSVFSELGNAVEAEWRRFNYEASALPAIAQRQLEATKPWARCTPMQIVEWALSAGFLGMQQAQGEFGQPPVNVYTHRRFFIEALFWLDASMLIHQHSFEGAFCVLQGSSVHCTYAFERTHKISDRTLVGELRYLNAELLVQGSVRTIEAGPRFIHALYHLERPSVSIVVRSTTNRSTGPQYVYAPPALALDPVNDDTWSRRVPEFLNVALAMNASNLSELLATALTQGDDSTCIAVLNRVHEWLEHGHPAANELCKMAMAHVREKIGSPAEAVFASIAELQRREKIGRMRQRVFDPDLRYLLALLMNVPNRRSILALTKDRYPQSDPVERVITGIAALTSGNAPLLPLSLGADALRLLAFMLRDLSKEQIFRELGEGETLDEESITSVEQSMAALSRIAFFHPLFA